MATTIRPCFVRPFEFISETSDFSIGATSHNIASGTYKNVWSLLQAVYTEAGATISNISMTDDLLIRINAGASATITWDNTHLRDALGFTGPSLSMTSGNWYTATYTPEYIWCPEHNFADQGSFWQLPTELVVGEKSLNGNLACSSLGTTRYTRSMRFNAETGSHIAEELCTTVYEIERCLDTFYKGAVTSAPTIYTHAPTKGFWYYQDVNAFIADCTYNSDEWNDSGGIRFNLSSNPDTYVFCQFDPHGLGDWRTAPFFPRSRIRYNVELTFTTAPAGEYL